MFDDMIRLVASFNANVPCSRLWNSILFCSILVRKSGISFDGVDHLHSCLCSRCFPFSTRSFFTFDGQCFFVTFNYVTCSSWTHFQFFLRLTLRRHSDFVWNVQPQVSFFQALSAICQKRAIKFTWTKVLMKFFQFFVDI